MKFETDPVKYGIVADSVPESEWTETQKKARAVLRAAEMVLEGLDAEVHR